MDRKLMKRGWDVIAEFDGGLPAMVEGRLGSGRIIFFSMGFDKKSSNAPFSLQFVPFIHELARYIAESGNNLSGKDIWCGEKFYFHINGKMSDVYTLVDGNGKKLSLETRYDGDRIVLESERIEKPGIYELISNEIKMGKRKFCSNLPSKEEILLYLKDKKFNREYSENDKISRKVMVELSNYIIYLFFLFLFVETYLLFRMDRDEE